MRFTTARPGGAALQRKVIAAAVAPTSCRCCASPGFEVRTISTAVLNAGFDWSRIDVLYVGAGLNYTQLNAAAKAALDAFLQRGGVITRGATGAKFNIDAKLLAGHPGRRLGGRQRRGERRQRHRSGRHGRVAALVRLLAAVVHEPRRRCRRSSSATAPRSIAAGHWHARDNGTGGQDAAAGQAAVVSGTCGIGREGRPLRHRADVPRPPEGPLSRRSRAPLLDRHPLTRVKAHAGSFRTLLGVRSAPRAKSDQASGGRKPWAERSNQLPSGSIARYSANGRSPPRSAGRGSRESR